MTANDRPEARAAERSRRILGDLASALRSARLETGWSQEQLGRRLGMSGDKIWQIEHQKLPSLSINDACHVAGLLGFDLVCKLYPSGLPIRDAGQARRLVKLLNNVQRPLRFVTDAPLPPRDGVP